MPSLSRSTPASKRPTHCWTGGRPGRRQARAFCSASASAAASAAYGQHEAAVTTQSSCAAVPEAGGGGRLHRLCYLHHRALGYDLAEEPAELTVADHGERACRRAGARREDVQLQECRSGEEADAAGSVEML